MHLCSTAKMCWICEWKKLTSITSEIKVTVFLLLMHKYIESLHTFFWAVSGTRLDLSFSFRSVAFQVQMNLKGRLVFPNLFFPVGHKYEAADSAFFLLSPNILYCCDFCPLIAILFFSYFNDFGEDVSFICSVKCLTDWLECCELAVCLC